MAWFGCKSCCSPTSLRDCLVYLRGQGSVTHFNLSWPHFCNSRRRLATQTVFEECWGNYCSRYWQRRAVWLAGPSMKQSSRSIIKAGLIRNHRLRPLFSISLGMRPGNPRLCFVWATLSGRSHRSKTFSKRCASLSEWRRCFQELHQNEPHDVQRNRGWTPTRQFSRCIIVDNVMHKRKPVIWPKVGIPDKWFSPSV